MSRSRSRSGWSSSYGGLGEKVENAERCGELALKRLGREAMEAAMEGEEYVLVLVLAELLGLTGG